MKKMECDQIRIEDNNKAAQRRSGRHNLFKSIPMIIAAAITLFTCYQVMNNQINVDGATIIVSVCIIGLVVSVSIIDK